MQEVRKNDEKLKKKHFARLHERIQNKYDQMQKRLEKSKSVDSLSSLKEDYEYKESRYSSTTSVNEIEEFTNNVPLEKCNVIIEEINKKDARLQFFNVREISISESETTPNEKYENDIDRNINKFFAEEFSKLSLESLNEVAKESDEYLTPGPESSPTNSIRNKIGSRISAAKDKRRQKEKEKNTTQRAENEKKTPRDKVEKFILSNTTKHDVPILKVSKRTKVATVTIALIEATGLESDILEEKARLLFCRFRLGLEKYKSKVIKNPKSSVKWQELFNFNLYDDHILEMSLWNKDFCVGRNHIDLSELEKEKTHKIRMKLDGDMGNAEIFILLTISGISLVSVDEFQETQKRLLIDRKNIAEHKYKEDSSNVGFLTIIVYGAKGLGNSECYCVLEIDNERLQTHTELKTHEPNWMKIFTFDVSDITSILDITIHDEKKNEVVGCLSIPLLNIQNGKQKWYALKDSNLRDRAKGNNPRILLEMDLTWKLVKASVRVINPKESKYLSSEEKIDRHTFTKNLTRAKVVLNWIFAAFRVTKTCFEWESRKMNVIALAFWLLFCWFFKMWMLPLLLLVPFVWYRPRKYFLLSWKEYLLKKTMQLVDENKEKEEKSQSLRQKINSLQEMVQSVHNFIQEFADLGESVKNLFNFTVPFLSLLAIFLILVITVVMFLIPTNYIFMMWGIHKFTRKILRPNRIANNEILDLLSRVPNDEILLNCKEMPLEDIPDEDNI